MGRTLRNQPRWRTGTVIFCLAAGWIGYPIPSAAETTILFEPVSLKLGIENDQYSSPTFHSLGVNWVDVDMDGWVDLFAVNGYGSSAHIYRNVAGTFTKMDHYLPLLPNVDMAGSVFADYDNDGDPDIYIYTDNEQFDLFGPNDPTGPPNLLLKNLWVENGGRAIPGKPLFALAATEAGVADLAPTGMNGEYSGMRAKTAAWLDFDVDGCVDLFVGHWAFQAEGTIANRDRLYQNQCDGTFADVSDKLYPTATEEFPGARYRPTLASMGADLDGDLIPDLYLVSTSSVQHYQSVHHDRLLWNQGGFFRELQFPGIGDDASAGMGIDIADIDLDGDWDLYITDLNQASFDAEPAGNVLYLNEGNKLADNTATAANVAGDDSWGTNFFDADQDGYEDLLVMTMASASSGPFLYRNLGDGTFSNVLERYEVSSNLRGSAIADFDRDGDLDIAAVQQNGRLLVFRNVTSNPGAWLQLALEGAKSNRSGIGTRVEVTAGTRSMIRQIKGGSSGHGQDDLLVHFGLGTVAIVDRVTIRWPSGAVQTFEGLQPNQRLTIIEPDNDQ